MHRPKAWTRAAFPSVLNIALCLRYYTYPCNRFHNSQLYKEKQNCTTDRCDARRQLLNGLVNRWDALQIDLIFQMSRVEKIITFWLLRNHQLTELKQHPPHPNTHTHTFSHIHFLSYYLSSQQLNISKGVQASQCSFRYNCRCNIPFFTKCIKCWIIICLFVHTVRHWKIEPRVWHTCEAEFYIQIKVPLLTVRMVVQFNNVKGAFRWLN